MIHPVINDVGRFVVYRSKGLKPEAGRISAVRPEFIHVRFPGNEHSGACRREDLTWLDDLAERPTPPDEPELAAIAERHAASARLRPIDESEEVRNLVEAVWLLEGPTPDFLNHSWDDVGKLLAAIADRDAMLADVAGDEGYQQGRREVLGAALDAMDAVIEDMRVRAGRGLGPVGHEGTNAVTRVRNLLTEKLIDLTPADPLPAGQVRAENVRLRAVLRQGVTTIEGNVAARGVMPSRHEIQPFISAAREVLGEEEPT